MKLFRDLTPEQAEVFRKWARQHYQPFAPIDGIWHPVIQAECALINAEADLELSKVKEKD